MRRALPVLLAAFVLAGCTATSGNGSPPAAKTTATTTATATATVTATPSPASSDVDLAKRLVTLACQEYVYSGTLDAASGSAPLDESASGATTAAVLDPTWTKLAGALGFLAALPLTDVPTEDQTRASTELAVVKSRCGDVGVTVTS